MFKYIHSYVEIKIKTYSLSYKRCLYRIIQNLDHIRNKKTFTQLYLLL